MKTISNEALAQISQSWDVLESAFSEAPFSENYTSNDIWPLVKEYRHLRAFEECFGLEGFALLEDRRTELIDAESDYGVLQMKDIFKGKTKPRYRSVTCSQNYTWRTWLDKTREKYPGKCIYLSVLHHEVGFIAAMDERGINHLSSKSASWLQFMGCGQVEPVPGLTHLPHLINLTK